MRQAVALQQTIVKQCPDVLAYAVWLAVMERSLGHVLMERGDWAEASTPAILCRSASSATDERVRKDGRRGSLPPSARVLGGGIS